MRLYLLHGLLCLERELRDLVLRRSRELRLYTSLWIGKRTIRLRPGKRGDL